MNRSLQLPQPFHPRQQLYNNSTTDPPKYCLTVRQQPQKARLCSFKEKVDRRPLDPPPIVQLYQSSTMSFNDYHNSSNFFLHTTLANANDNNDIHCANGNRTTAGSVVQSLHKLKDTNDAEGAFFIFSDISIRIEGIFKLKFTLFEIKGMNVERVCSVYSDPFQVYSPKNFPGMSESTDLTRSFSDQGVRIRIRKEARAVKTPSSMKRRRGMDQQHYQDSSIEFYSSSSASTTPKEESSSSMTGTSTNNVMSMQNLLLFDPPNNNQSSSPILSSKESLFPSRNILPLPPQQQQYQHNPLTIESLVTPEHTTTGTRHYSYSTTTANSSDQQQQHQLPSLLRHHSSSTTTSTSYPYHYENTNQSENPSL